jgi:hypothetical protein
MSVLLHFPAVTASRDALNTISDLRFDQYAFRCCEVYLKLIATTVAIRAKLYIFTLYTSSNEQNPGNTGVI